MGEYSRAVNDPTYGSLGFIVDKIGGGEVGKAYAGEWNVYISRFGAGIFDGRIVMNRPVTHWDMCAIALEHARKTGRI